MVLSLPISHKDLGAGGKLHLIGHTTLSAVANSVTFHFSPMYTILIGDCYYEKDSTGGTPGFRLNGVTSGVYDVQLVNASDSTLTGERPGLLSYGKMNGTGLDSEGFNAKIIIAKPLASEDALALVESGSEDAAAVELSLTAVEVAITDNPLFSLEFRTTDASGNLEVGGSFSLYGVTL